MLVYDDVVSINASANSNNGWWWWGGGNDPATAKGLANSDIDLGSGNDFLSVSASTNGGISNATALEDSNIDAGSGNDVININATLVLTARLVVVEPGGIQPQQKVSITPTSIQVLR